MLHTTLKEGEGGATAKRLVRDNDSSIKGELNPKIKFVLFERTLKITVSYLSVFDSLLRFWDISVSLICKLLI